MTDVLIARLSAATSGEDQPRVRRLLRGMVDWRLDDAITAADLPPGEWCVRRMDVPVRLDAGRPDAVVQSAWAEEIAAALGNLLRHPPPGQQLAYYPRTMDALADMLGTLAVGHAERAWAWRQLGLLEPGDPDPHVAPCGAALAALRRRAAEAIPALVAAVRLAGVDALHRLFGSNGWDQVARLVIALHRADGGLVTPWTGDSGSDSPPRIGPLPVTRHEPPDRPRPSVADNHGEPGRSPVAGGRGGQQSTGSHVSHRLVRSIRARSPLAVAFARARIRPDVATAWAWAVLAAADAEPALFGRPVARSTLAMLAQGFAVPPSAGIARTASTTESTTGQETAVRRQISGHEAESAPGPTAATADGRAEAAGGGTAADMRAEAAGGAAAADGRAEATAETRAAELDTDGLRDTGPSAWPTDWAGLLFFLATAAEAGLPEGILSDEVLADQPLSWTLYQLARRLTPAAEPTDPALFALAGLAPGDEPQQPQAAEAAHLDAHAAGWAHVTAARLGRSEHHPFDVAGQLAARTGSIMVSPGWIEVHLDLGDVDIDVRRAGLDVDPGWVPWLGVVVIFVYE
jgi:hypothetical protein